MCGIGVIQVHCLIRLSYTDVSVYLSIPSPKQPIKPIKHLSTNVIPNGSIVQGGYLNCDGSGKRITFEMHCGDDQLDFSECFVHCKMVQEPVFSDAGTDGGMYIKPI